MTKTIWKRIFMKDGHDLVEYALVVALIAYAFIALSGEAAHMISAAFAAISGAY